MRNRPNRIVRIHTIPAAEPVEPGKVCPRCGQVNDAGRSSCERCGQGL